jgi:hypothetical protein
MPSRTKDRITGVHLRFLIALAVAALAAGCSSIRLGYNNADTLLVRGLDSYFDLNAPQEHLARESVRKLVAWHRATQLHAYADFIESAGQRVEGRVAADEVLAFNLEMNRKLVAIGTQAAPDLAALALTLQPAQLDHFARKLSEDDAKIRRETAASKRSVDKRIRRSIERAEEWFGFVSPQQEELIRSALAQQPDSEDWWVQEREQRRNDLLKLLRRIQAERPAVDEAARWLHEYFALLTEPQDPSRRDRMNEFRHGNAELIAALINAASAEQKAALLKKLHGYAEDFTALASAGGTRS